MKGLKQKYWAMKTSIGITLISLLVPVALQAQDLFTAADQGDVAAVEMLLTEGVDVNMPDDDGYTALISAYNNNHSKIVDILIDNGAIVIDMHNLLGLGSNGPNLIERISKRHEGRSISYKAIGGYFEDDVGDGARPKTNGLAIEVSINACGTSQKFVIKPGKKGYADYLPDVQIELKGNNNQNMMTYLGQLIPKTKNLKDGTTHPYAGKRILQGYPHVDCGYIKENSIVVVQRLLNKAGFNAGIADGLFGAKTREALKKYQEYNNLPITGKIDKISAKALGIETYVPQEAVIASEAKTYRNDQLGFEISYLENWGQSHVTGDSQFVIKRKSEPESGTISIMVRNFTGNKESTMRELKAKPEKLVEKHKQSYQSAEMVENGEIFLGGFPGYFITTKVTMKKMNVEVDKVVMQIFCIKDRKIYLVNFGTPLILFEKTSKEFHAILATFNFQ